MPRGRPKKQPSIADLQRMLNEVRSRKQKLNSERNKLQKRMDQIDRELSRLEGAGASAATGGGKRSRGRNASNLPDAMEAVMRQHGKPMKVGDIVEAVQKQGYHSTSANFRGIVNQTLIKDNRFKSSARGVYELKK